jgi:hypothetical protein
MTDSTVREGGGNITPELVASQPLASRRNKRAPGELIRILGFTLALALATSCLYFRAFKDFYTADSQGYITPASSLLEGKGFADAAGDPDTLRTPGYPLLIVPFIWGHVGIQYLILLQHLLRVAVILATCIFAWWLTGSRRQAFLAALAMCLDLPFLRYTNYIMTETLFTVVLSAVLLLLWLESKDMQRPGLRCVATGFLAGALVLIRPIALFFFVPVAAYLLLTRKSHKLRAAVVFVAAFACTPMLWAARNYHGTGYFTVSSISGYSVQFRGAGVLAINDPGDFYSNLDKRSIELAELTCRDWQSRYGRSCAQMSVPEKSKVYASYGSKIIFQHPLAYAKVVARGLGVTMLAGSPASLSKLTGMSFNLASRVLLFYTLPAFSFSIVGLWAFWRSHRPFFWLALFTCMYFVGIAAGPESFARFRVPIMPVYAVLIASGIDAGVVRFASWRALGSAAHASQRDSAVERDI